MVVAGSRIDIPNRFVFRSRRLHRYGFIKEKETTARMKKTLAATAKTETESAQHKCPSECKYVLCPYCQILNRIAQQTPPQPSHHGHDNEGQQQQRRQRSGSSSSSIILLSEPTGVGLGFHIQDVLRTIRKQDRNKNNNNNNHRSFSDLSNDDSSWRQRQQITPMSPLGKVVFILLTVRS